MPLVTYRPLENGPCAHISDANTRVNFVEFENVSEPEPQLGVYKSTFEILRNSIKHLHQVMSPQSGHFLVLLLKEATKCHVTSPEFCIS